MGIKSQAKPCRISQNYRYICRMNFDTKTTVAFTGHRTYNGEADIALRETIVRLYNDGYRTFLCGMATGFDMAAAEAVLELRDEQSDIRLVCVVPFEGQSRRFNAEQRNRYDTICRAANHVVTLATQYSPMAYHRRNDFLVDNSSALIAYFDGSKGGTAYTVRRATKSLHRYTNLYIDPQQEFAF